MARDARGRFTAGDKSAGKVVAYVDSSTVGFNAGIAEAQMRLNAFAASAQKAGLKMTMYLTLPLVLIGRKAAKAFGEFDTAMTESVSIMSGVTEELRAEMEKTARTISTKSIKSSAELAKSYYFLASAGLSAEKSMAVLGLVERFATAGAFDMARATDLLTDAQSALGLTVEDTAANTANMSRVSNVLVKANTLANASVEQFATSLTAKAGTAMRLVNMEVEEGTAVLMAFADQGIKSQLAGNALNIVLRDLQTASRKNADEWERLGIEVYDSSGAMNNMADIVAGLENALGSMSIEQKTATLSLLGFTDRSKAFTGALLGMSGKIRQYEKALRSAGDITETVANEQMKGFEAQSKAVNNQINISFQLIGKKLAPILLALKKAFAAVLSVVSSLPGPLQAVLVVVGLLAAAIGPMILLLGSLTRAWIALKTITWLHTAATWALVTAKSALLAVMAALGGPLVVALAIAGLVAMGVAITLLIKKVRQGRAELDGLNQVIGDMGGAGRMGIKLPMKDVEELTKKLGAMHSLATKGVRAGDLSDFMALKRQLQEALPLQSKLIGKVARGDAMALWRLRSMLAAKEMESLKAQVAVAAKLMSQKEEELAKLRKRDASWDSISKKMEELNAASQEYNRLLDTIEDGTSKVADAFERGAENADKVLKAVQETVKASAEQIELTKHLEDVKFDLLPPSLGKDIETVKREYAGMIDEARKAGLDVTALQTARDLRIAELIRQRQKEDADAVADVAHQTKRVRIQATMEGIDEELALLDLAHQRELDNAGEGQAQLIAERYDLEEKMIKDRYKKLGLAEKERVATRERQKQMDAIKARAEYELEGLARQLVLLELAKQEEIARAEAAGLSTDAIIKKFDWMKKSLEGKAGREEAGTPASKFAAALQKGSIAAYSAALQDTLSTDEEIEENTSLIAEHTEEANEFLKDIVDELAVPAVVLTML